MFEGLWPLLQNQNQKYISIKLIIILTRESSFIKFSSVICALYRKLSDWLDVTDVNVVD